MEYVLILGAKSDIAKAIATIYAQNGYGLFLAARDSNSLERFANDLQIRYNIKAKLKEFDAVNFRSHYPFYESLEIKPVGTILCFGYLGKLPGSEKDTSEILNTINVNFTAAANILSMVANDYEKKKNGFIIGISSVAGDRGRSTNYIYGSSKAGFTEFLSGLRNRLHKNGVQVMTVKPGFVKTKMTKDIPINEKLSCSPEDLAKHIFKSQRKGRDVIYSSFFWRIIMLIIIHLPEKIFKRLSL